MKKLTLDQTWSRCLAMWRWIVKQIPAGTDADVLGMKHKWLRKYQPHDNPDHECYFCEWAAAEAGAIARSERCPKCPGRKIDERFVCDSDAYHYAWKPTAFLRKLEQLNAKRLAMNQGKPRRAKR